MGFWDSVTGFFSNIGSGIKHKILEPLFGQNRGALSNFTNTVANKVTGGADNFGDALVNATLKGGAVDALSYASKQAAQGLDSVANKASEIAGKVPIVGGALQAGIEDIAAPVRAAVSELEKPLDAVQTAVNLGKQDNGAIGAALRTDPNQFVNSQFAKLGLNTNPPLRPLGGKVAL